MPSVKTHFIELKLSPESGAPPITYTQLNTDKRDLSFAIDAKHNITIRFHDKRARTIKFNVVSVYLYKLDNIQDLRTSGQAIGFVYDAVEKFPVKVTVKFLRHEDYRDAVDNINAAKFKAESDFS